MKPDPAADARQEAIAKAVYFRMVAFRGRGEFAENKAPTLDEARAQAATIYLNRPVGIYAVWMDGNTERAIHIENWSPPKGRYKRRNPIKD